MSTIFTRRKVYYIVMKSTCLPMPGYRGAVERNELKGTEVGWHIAERPVNVRSVKKHSRIDKATLKADHLKARISAKVEHPSRIIKCQFGFTNALYRRLMKNDSKLAMPCTLVNIARVGPMLRV